MCVCAHARACTNVCACEYASGRCDSVNLTPRQLNEGRMLSVNMPAVDKRKRLVSTRFRRGGGGGGEGQHRSVMFQRMGWRSAARNSRYVLYYDLLVRSCDLLLVSCMMQSLGTQIVA